jgi:CotH kinase protein/Lamin Tail Domain/Dockerin type I domain
MRITMTLCILALLSFVSLQSAPARVVINEIHYHPAFDPCERLDEYIELYNSGSQQADMSGWRLSTAVQYTFPEATVLQTGQYLVVCVSEEHLRFRFGLTGKVLGGWQGRLNNSGEKLYLQDKNGSIIDQVEYDDVFPWPYAPDGAGRSLERIDPHRDFSGAWNWRACQQWAWSRFHYIGFVSHNSFRMSLSGGGQVRVDDMQLHDIGSTSNGFTNSGFETGLTGWAPGDEHAGSYVNPADAHSGSACLEIVATYQGEISGGNYVKQTLSSSYNREMAISYWAKYMQGSWNLTTSLRNGSLYQKTDVRFAGTPGAGNSVYSASGPGPLPARIIQNPIRPLPHQPVAVTAIIYDDGAIAAATLEYEYYYAETIGLPMTYQSSPSPAGWKATLPALPEGHFVRYRILAEDDNGVVRSCPDDGEPTQRFAALYTSEQPHSVFPTCQVFMRPMDKALMSANWYNDTYRRALLFMDGEPFDNIRLRPRGDTARGPWTPKKSYKIKFNPGHRYQQRSTMNLAASMPDYSRVREIVGYDFLHRTANAWCETDIMRVYMDGIFLGPFTFIEQPDDHYLERNGLDPDGHLHKANDKEDGQSNLAGYVKYYDKNTRDWSEYEPIRDMVDTLRDIDPIASPQQMRAWLDANVDVTQAINNLAAMTCLGGRDHFNKNHLYYQNPDNGKWQLLSWDLDLILGKDWASACGGIYCHQNDHTNPLLNGVSSSAVFPGNLRTSISLNYFVDRILNPSYSYNADWRQAYYLRVRELLDTEYTRAKIDPLLDAMMDLVRPEVVHELQLWPFRKGVEGWKNQMPSIADFDNQRTAIKTFIDNRTAYLRSKLDSLNLPTNTPTPTPTITPGGPGDIWLDGSQNSLDLLYFSTFWNAEETSFNYPADLDENGTVNEADLLRLIDYLKSDL